MAGTFTTRNTPLLAAQSGADTQPLPAGPVLRLSDLFTVPAAANAAWIQVPSGALLFRLDGDLAGAAWLTLPGLSFLPLTNRSQLERMVMTSGGGTLSVSVQFFEGALGPMPPAPVAEIGGSGPPPPPSGLTSLPTNNVVHVMKNGNDATGQRNRLDLPFLTITAAKAVLVPGDVMMIWPGVYEEGGIDVPNVTYQLVGAEIIGQSDSPFVFGIGEDNSVMVIRGSGSIGRVEDGSGSPLLYGSKLNPRFYVDLERVYNENGPIAQSDEGASLAAELFLNARVQCANLLGTAAIGGFNTVRVRGDIECTKAFSVFSVNSPEMVVVSWGNITSEQACVTATGGGSVTVYGDLISITGPAVACADGGNVDVHGLVQASGSRAAVYVETGTNVVNVWGQVRAELLGAVFLDESTEGSVVNVHGDIFSEFQHGVWCKAGAINVWGDIETAGVITNANAVLCEGTGVCHVWGNLKSVAGAAGKTNGGLLHIHGNAHAENRWGIYTLAGGEIIIDGIASSTTFEGAWIQGLGGPCRMTILGGASTQVANGRAVIFSTGSGNVLVLGGACRLEPNGTGFSVGASGPGASDIRSRGASGLNAIDPSLTVSGTFNVEP